MPKTMELKNGFVLIWDSVLDDGTNLSVDAASLGQGVTLIYDRITYLIENVVSDSDDLGDNVYKGVKLTSGTWREKSGTAVGTNSNTVKNNKKKVKRKNKAHVYFWTRRDKDGTILYCHSHKLCENDPMGKALFEEWKKDPEMYMHKHPDLEQKA